MSFKRSPGWKIYGEQMAQLDHGDALWEPAPLNYFERVQLGDVGYVRRGCFHLLFSAGKPLGERQLGVDVPLTFQPLTVGPIVNTQPRLPGCLSTNTVRESGVGLEASICAVPALQPGFSISFELLEKQGAALVTKYPTYREDIQREQIFEEYTKRHYDSWVAFAREAGHGSDVKPVLVTGLDMTRDFAMMSYLNNGVRLKSEFVASVPGVASASASAWGTWRTEGLVHTNCGPQACLPPSPAQAADPLSPGASRTEPISEEYNQCVFVRYYTMRKRRLLIPKIIKAGAGPHHLGPGDRNGEGPPLEAQYESDSDSDDPPSLFDCDEDDGGGSVTSVESEFDIVAHNTAVDERDDFDAVADYIFWNSDAESVLVHHRDIALLRRDGGSKGAIALLLKKKLPIVVDENGVGKIQHNAGPSSKTLSDDLLDAVPPGPLFITSEIEHEARSRAVLPEPQSPLTLRSVPQSVAKCTQESATNASGSTSLGELVAIVRTDDGVSMRSPFKKGSIFSPGSTYRGRLRQELSSVSTRGTGKVAVGPSAPSGFRATVGYLKYFSAVAFALLQLYYIFQPIFQCSAPLHLKISQHSLTVSIYSALSQLSCTDPNAGVAIVYNNGDITWTLASTVIVWLMIPGVGFFYSGLIKRKNVLSHTYFLIGVIGVLVPSFAWLLRGDPLTFSNGDNEYGDLGDSAFKIVEGHPSSGSTHVSLWVFAVYQCLFSAITLFMTIGAVAERGRFGPTLLVAFLWSTVVYEPLACMVRNTAGWSFAKCGLAFAGGTPVYISGAAVLSVSLYLGKRIGLGTENLAQEFRNTAYIILGTFFLWFGWFGFNGVNILSACIRAASSRACLPIAIGALTSGLLGYRLRCKWFVVGLCSCAVSCFVTITQDSSFVGSPASVILTAMTYIVRICAIQLAFTLEYDDTVHIFVSHSIGVVVGNLLTGVFVRALTRGLGELTKISEDRFDENYIPLAGQQMGSIAVSLCSFLATTIFVLCLIYLWFHKGTSRPIGIGRFLAGGYPWDRLVSTRKPRL